jgi:antitoxin component YwqK of YwqJK toxin-antitoxin module
MRLLTILYLVLLSIHSYSQEVIPEAETVARNSLMYHQDTNGLVTGTIEGFHENGQLEFRRDYKDGEQVGLYEIFHENGQLEFRSNYIDGELDGLYEYFHENGQLNVRGNYIDGIPDGLFEEFDENGNLTKTETWENGEVVEINPNP